MDDLYKKGHKIGSETLPMSTMKKEYDFSKAKKNPYSSQLKKQITIRIDSDAISYFKEISEQIGIPYQSLINLYLKDCVTSKRKLKIKWD